MQLRPQVAHTKQYYYNKLIEMGQELYVDVCTMHGCDPKEMYDALIKFKQGELEHVENRNHGSSRVWKNKSS